MFINGKRLYDVLDRCEDLFPEWVRENNSFWNRTTGEIVCENGTMMHDLVYRNYAESSDTYADTTECSKMELGCLNTKYR